MYVTEILRFALNDSLYAFALKKDEKCLSVQRKAVPLQADYYQKVYKGLILSDLLILCPGIDGGEEWKMFFSSNNLKKN